MSLIAGAAVALSMMTSSAYAADAFASKRETATPMNLATAEKIRLTTAPQGLQQIVDQLQIKLDRTYGTTALLSVYLMPHGDTYVICGRAINFKKPEGETGTFVFTAAPNSTLTFNTSDATAKALGCFSGAFVTLK